MIRMSLASKIVSIHSEVNAALDAVFSEKKSMLVFALSTLAAGALYVLIPLATTPGFSIDYYLQIVPWYNYALLALFSLGFGLLFSMQYYIFTNKASGGKKAVGYGGILSVVVAGAYSTAACSACVSTLFSVFGFGGVLFLTSYRTQLLF